jgi:hypothetical protein
MRRWQLCAVMAIAAGCSVEGLIGGEALQLPGSSDGGHGDPLLDAAGDQGTGGLDSGGDVALPDAGSTWCSGQTVTFCADFDRGPLPGVFDSQSGTYLALTSAKSTSKPQSLLMTVPASSATGSYQSYLAKSFTQTSKNINLSFDVSFEKVNTTTVDGLLVFEIGFKALTDAHYAIRLSLYQQKARFEENQSGLTDVQHSPFSLPTAPWTRYSIDLALDQGAGTLTFKRDGGGAIQYTLRVPAQIELKPTLEVGAVYGTTPHNGWVLEFDNLTFDLK